MRLDPSEELLTVLWTSKEWLSAIHIAGVEVILSIPLSSVLPYTIFSSPWCNLTLNDSMDGASATSSVLQFTIQAKV